MESNHKITVFDDDNIYILRFESDYKMVRNSHHIEIRKILEGLLEHKIKSGIYEVEIKIYSCRIWSKVRVYKINFINQYIATIDYELIYKKTKPGTIDHKKVKGTMLGDLPPPILIPDYTVYDVQL